MDIGHVTVSRDPGEWWVGYRHDHDVAQHVVSVIPSVLIAWEAGRRYTWRRFVEEHPARAAELRARYGRRITRMNHTELWEFFGLSTSYGYGYPRCKQCGRRWDELFERMASPVPCCDGTP